MGRSCRQIGRHLKGQDTELETNWIQLDQWKTLVNMALNLRGPRAICCSGCNANCSIYAMKQILCSKLQGVILTSE